MANETTLRTRQDSYWESDEVATIFFYCDGTLFDTWTVTIFEAPEFISFANDTTINDDQLTTGFNTHTLPNDPVYIPQIHAASGRALDYILTEYSLPTCLWGPQGSDGHFNYVNSRQEDGLRFGRETFTLMARYALDPSFSDTISVTIAWADVDKAKSDLAAEYEAFLANDGLLALLAPAERAGQLEINLQNLASFGDSSEDSLSRTNVSYAIRFTELLQQNDLPYAARVIYCDGSEEIYSLPSEEQE